VYDGATMAGTGAAFTFDVVLPGGGTLPMSSVTEVGVAPTHRRQGILRAIMGSVLDQALERDEPIAGLTASEATIYRRFGFGVASRFQTVAIDRARGQRLLDTPALAPPVPGRLHLLTDDEATTVLPAVWQRHWRRNPGELSRSPGWWAAEAVDPDEDRAGMTARFRVVHEGVDGEPDGFALYRLRFEWPGSDPNVLQLEDLAAVDDAVEAALLRFVLDVDLVEQVVWFAAPLDHPLRWRLADHRAARVTAERDHLWLRPLDVARCLATRRYATSGGFVVEVVDGDRPALGGRFRLDAGAGGADCARTTADADITLDVADLGRLLLGGVTWTTLGRAGVLVEETPGALARADALFRPERAPFCGTHF
jgi:predicted acetyltransferase